MKTQRPLKCCYDFSDLLMEYVVLQNIHVMKYNLMNKTIGATFYHFRLL